MAERKYVVLDGIRGFAALAVLERHLFPHIERTTMLPSSYLAVDLFFMLSGFVLSYAYADKLDKGLSLATFMVRRLERLYPLYLLAALLAFSSLLSKPHSTAEVAAYVANTFYVPLPLGSTYHLFPLNFPAWSLFYELLVNFVFAAIWPWLTNRMLALVICVGGALLVLGSFYYGSLDTGAHWFDALGGVGRVTFSFFVGVALQRLPIRKEIFAPWASVALVSATAFTFWLRFKTHQDISDLVTVMVVYPLIVSVAARCLPDTYSSRIMTVLGLASYALYVLQDRFVHIGVAIAERMNLQPSPLLAVTFTAGFLAVCVALDAFYDAPVRRILARNRRSASLPEPAGA